MIVGQQIVSEYASYLTLEEILVAQHPRTDQHDEMLFIIAHQVHELWFKQLLHELANLQVSLAKGDTVHTAHGLRRSIAILQVVVTPIDVLDTLTPSQFNSFRLHLGTGSGFQSAQFREIEAVLARRDPMVFARYAEGSPEREKIEAAMLRPCLFDSFLQYLAARGYDVPRDQLFRDVTRPLEPCEELEDFLLEIYRTDNETAQICDQMVELDQRMQDWRYRHVSLVERIIGQKAGTGGTSGASYLRTTLFRPMFPDLWAIRSRL